MKDEAEKRGFKLIVTDAQDNTAKQVSDVEDLIAQNIDLLILSPREFEGLETALQTAKENSVPRQILYTANGLQEAASR